MWPFRCRAEARPPISPVHGDTLAAEARVRRLRRGFRKVSRRWERPQWRHQLKYPALAFVGTVLVTTYLSNSPWPVTLTLRHLIAYPNCDATRMVGLAPARESQPGYWRHNDRDHDGIACERYRPPLRHMIVPLPL